MDLRSKRSLQVSIENVSFAKEFNYFLTLQLDGDGENEELTYQPLSVIRSFLLIHSIFLFMKIK